MKRNCMELKQLTYYYPLSEKPSLRNINLSVEKGDVVLICGKSGSGKSTLAKTMTGSVPDFYGGTIQGELYMNGENARDIDKRSLAKEVTMVFQDPERQLMMNKVHREVAFGLENLGMDSKTIKRRVWEALKFSGMLDKAHDDVGSLSGGQKQMVAIASAIAFMSNCIVLDEPISQLDPAAAEEVVELVRKINDELGTTIVVIEQRVDKWFQLADKVVVMKDGEISFSGTKEEMYRKDDDYENEFLPGYLKFAKKLNVKDMPVGLKSLRRIIDGMNVVTDDCSIKEKDGDRKNCQQVIEFRNVSFGYEKGSVALKEVNAVVNKGDMMCILGSNGAGKSTLLKSVMGLTKYKGSIRMEGSEVRGMKLKDIARKTAYVSQNPNDYISKDTVFDELKFTMDNFGMKNMEIMDETLKKLGICHLKYRNPRDVSGGERQRIAIASMLVLEPEIILLDEPTRGLDSETKDNLGMLLEELNERGNTVVTVTHDLEFAAKYFNRFALMFNGEVVSIGSREEVLSEGIYYSTTANKLFRNVDQSIFTFEEALKNVNREAWCK